MTDLLLRLLDFAIAVYFAWYGLRSHSRKYHPGTALAIVGFLVVIRRMW